MIMHSQMQIERLVLSWGELWAAGNSWGGGCGGANMIPCLPGPLHARGHAGAGAGGTGLGWAAPAGLRVLGAPGIALAGRGAWLRILLFL